jgi:hypothetical protein
VPLAEADEWLVQQLARGVLLDPKVFLALYWLTRTEGPWSFGPVN